MNTRTIAREAVFRRAFAERKESVIRKNLIEFMKQYNIAITETGPIHVKIKGEFWLLIQYPINYRFDDSVYAQTSLISNGKNKTNASLGYGAYTPMRVFYSNWELCREIIRIRSEVRENIEDFERYIKPKNFTDETQKNSLT